ncbi:unnamed protein product [Amoebophrya sp. A25]|nr:unnamed protein product [Amoebophrya sp. A25]|eukprot:GSA25T00020129001.1
MPVIDQPPPTEGPETFLDWSRIVEDGGRLPEDMLSSDYPLPALAAETESGSSSTTTVVRLTGVKRLYKLPPLLSEDEWQDDYQQWAANIAQEVQRRRPHLVNWAPHKLLLVAQIMAQVSRLEDD